MRISAERDRPLQSWTRFDPKHAFKTGPLNGR